MRTAVLYHSGLAGYSFGQGHPFGGERFEEFFNFFQSKCPVFASQFEVVEAQPAGGEALELVHTKDYIRAIQSASGGKVLPDIHRYVSADNLNPLTGYVPQGIEEGARIIVGISLLAGELITQNKFNKAIGIGGGMHHARPHYAEGFCFYNDIAICVKNLQKKHNLQRILVLDTDAHAGNGTKEIFYDDPGVLFIDIHQDPRTLYPGTGFISEIGSGKGEGFTVNIPMFPGAGNQAYKYVFEEVIFPLAEEFAPEVIIRYGGSDPHYQDSLTDLGLTLEGFRMIGQQVGSMADNLTQGRVIDLMLSGYNLAVLPFAWSALIDGLLDLKMDLSGLEEISPPALDCRLEETRQLVKQLKALLKARWRCMQ